MRYEFHISVSQQCAAHSFSHSTDEFTEHLPCAKHYILGITCTVKNKRFFFFKSML